MPADIPIVGFGDSWIATLVWPNLTTIFQPIGEMAATAVELFLTREKPAFRAKSNVRCNHVSWRVLKEVLARGQSGSENPAQPRIAKPLTSPFTHRLGFSLIDIMNHIGYMCTSRPPLLGGGTGLRADDLNQSARSADRRSNGAVNRRLKP